MTTAERLIDELSSNLRRLAQELEQASDALQADQAAAAEEEETAAAAAVEDPAALLARVQRLRRETLPGLRAAAEGAVCQKQALVEAVRTVAMANRRELLALQVAAGVPQLPAAGALAAFLAAADAWDRESGLGARSREALTLQLVKTAVPSAAAVASSEQQQKGARDNETAAVVAAADAPRKSRSSSSSGGGGAAQQQRRSVAVAARFSRSSTHFVEMCVWSLSSYRVSNK